MGKFEIIPTMNNNLKKCVFLDRDGVLNDSIVKHGKPYAPCSHEEFKIANGSISTVKKIKSMGFMTIIITNQPDISSGKSSPELMESFHKQLQNKMPIDDIYVCPHLEADNCSCRKPKPGLIYQAAEKHNIDLKSSFFIGDRWRDVGCAFKAGIKSIFIDHGYSEQLQHKPDFIISSIQFAEDCISRGSTLNEQS